MRTAVIERKGSIPAVAEVRAYLPANYRITEATETRITIAGNDVAGWTLDGYVIPRLASGLISAREIRDIGREV